MSLTPRPVRAPVLIRGCWALSVVSGAALLAVGPTAPRPEPTSLSPYSLAAYLSRAAAPDAQQIRVNGVYGSGHDGAWQFTAHLSWRDPTGTVGGGTTTLPQQAGSAALDSDVDADKLEAEQEIGWTLTELDAALDKLTGISDRLAMIELEIRGDGSGQAVSCHSPAVDAEAACRRVRRDGELGPTFPGTLTDSPLGEALSVRRTR